MNDTPKALPPHSSHDTVRDWMPVAEALRLADLWTVGDLDNRGQWRAAIKVLADEVRAALAQRQPTDNTEALPPLPKEFGRVLAHTAAYSTGGYCAEVQVEHMSHLHGRVFTDVQMKDYARAALAQRQQVPAITDAMVDAYLQANDAYWREVDALATDLTKPWRQGTPKEATRVSLAAALTAAPSAQAEPTRSQKMREAGFTARDNRLTCDECGAKFTAQFAPLHKCETPAAQAEPQEKK